MKEDLLEKAAPWAFRVDLVDVSTSVGVYAFTARNILVAEGTAIFWP